MSELYQQPQIYDAIHAEGAAAHFDLLLAVLRQSGVSDPTQGEWLEPACGTGRFLAEAVRRGIAIAGFDLSKAMVDYARQRMSNPAVDLFVADMVEFTQHLDQQRRFDVVFNLDNTFRHLDDDDAVRHLRQVSDVLSDDGRVVIGLQLTDYGADVIDEDVWTGGLGEARVTQVVQYLPPAHEADRRETVISHVSVEAPGQPTEHHDTSYTLRTYNAAQWRRLLRETPLNQCRWYDFEGRPSADAPIGYGFAVLTR